MLISHKISEIHQIIGTYKAQHSGLTGGMSGIMLYYSYLYQIENKKEYLLTIENILDTIFDNVASSKDIYFSYSAGLAGIGCVVEYIAKNNILDIDTNDCLSELDNVLITVLQNNLSILDLDFLHGDLGIILYLAEISYRNPGIIKILQQFVNKLFQIAEWNKEDSVKWKFSNTMKRKSEYNISLSHGMSAVVITLLRLKNIGLQNKYLDSLINSSINYILSQTIDFKKYGSYFSYLAIESEDDIRKSRLAWCYGDLGISIMLWEASILMHNNLWKEKAVEILLFAATERKNLSENHVFDAGLCHGSAGIAHIFYRMWINTQIIEFKRAMEYWFGVTLKMAKYKDGLAGYKTYCFSKNSHWYMNDFSFLEGITGIGMALNSYKNQVNPDWDKFLLLS
jgi:lantibiotic modifying enzyme